MLARRALSSAFRKALLVPAALRSRLARHLPLALGVMLWAGTAQATRIAILRPSASSPELSEAVFRLQGELLALDLEVDVADRAPADRAGTDSRAWVERLASERGSDAAIDVLGETKPTAVDIWIFQRSPRRVVVSRIVLEPDAPNAPETLAIRAIEVLRSNFVEIDLAARARFGERVAAPSQAAAQPPPPHVVRFGLEAGAQLLTSLDGVGPSVLPVVRFDGALRPWLVGQATFAGLGTRPTVDTAVGSARVTQRYGVLGLCYCSSSDPGIRPFLSLSAGVLQTLLDGRADPPARGHSVERWSFLMDASLGARLSLPSRYYVTLGAHVQLATPYVAIHFVDTQVGSTGRPNLLLSLTVGAWL
jgi:hypothetical protein